MAKPCRNFTISDALVLIAAIAIGFAWTRFYLNSEWGGESYPDIEGRLGPVSAFHHGVEVVNWWTTGVSNCLAVVTIALLILRLRGGPRRRLRYLTRRPGTVAGGAVLLTVSWDLLYAMIEVSGAALRAGSYDSIWQFTLLELSGHNAGVAVAAAWTLLALSGRWRREPGWLDGMGTALGVYWLLQDLLAYFAEVLFLLGL